MRKVQPGQKVRIGIEASGGQILQFFAYIKKVEPDRLLLMFSESKAQFAKFLEEGSTVRLSVYTPLGILLLNSVILSAPVGFEFEVEYESLSKRIQRRKYVRAHANYRLLINQMGKTITTLTEDIGGGGIRFIADTYIHQSEVNAKLYIPEIDSGIPFSGIVERKDRYKDNEYLIRYTNITEADRNKIIQKCLDIESKNIRED